MYVSFVELPCTIFLSKKQVFSWNTFQYFFDTIHEGWKNGNSSCITSSNCDSSINFRTHSKAPSIFYGLLDSNSNHELLASATPSFNFFKTFFVLITTNFHFDSGGVNKTVGESIKPPLVVFRKFYFLERG